MAGANYHLQQPNVNVNSPTGFYRPAAARPAAIDSTDSRNTTVNANGYRGGMEACRQAELNGELCNPAENDNNGEQCNSCSEDTALPCPTSTVPRRSTSTRSSLRPPSARKSISKPGSSVGHNGIVDILNHMKAKSQSLDELKATLSGVGSALLSIANSQRDFVAQTAASRTEMKEMLDRNLRYTGEHMEKLVDVLNTNGNDGKRNGELKKVRS